MPLKRRSVRPLSVRAVLKGNMLGPIWTSLGTEQGKLVAGFILTTVMGGFLAHLFQQLTWRRQARLDLFRQRYNEGTQLLERVTSLADRRFFRLQRFIWAITDASDPSTVALRETEYFDAVIQWNESLRAVHNGLRLLVGDTASLEFLDYSDDARPDAPRSLHYRFVRAHRAVLHAKSDPASWERAKQEVERLNWAVSRFVYDSTEVFMRRAASLALLRSTPPTTADRRARQIHGEHGEPARNTSET